MGLRCGIIGIANVGKTSLFNCISNTRAASSDYAFSSSKSNIGAADVPDDRLKEIGKLVQPEKLTPATVEIIDIPGLTKGSYKGEGVGNKFLADIRNTDALIHVLRCFDKENLSHIEGSVDPVRDLETINLELIIKDIESVENKIQKQKKAVKSGDKNIIKEIEVLQYLKDHLESFQPARIILLDDSEKKIIENLFLLTNKPVMYVCNVDENSVLAGNDYVEKVINAVKNETTNVLTIAAETEAEIAGLDDPEERIDFLELIGLKEPGINIFIRSAYFLLDLISFFTTSDKEVRAWTIKKGLSVHKAAGAVHSDFEKGFIRAEVIKFQDFTGLGSEQKCKEAGKIAVEGKDYIVNDGDIIKIRFNV